MIILLKNIDIKLVYVFHGATQFILTPELATYNATHFVRI